MKVSMKPIFALASILFLFFLMPPPCLGAPDEYEQQVPLKFSTGKGVVPKAGGITLESQVKQAGGQPIIVECENANRVDLPGSETATMRTDAGGNLVVRHVAKLQIDFTSEDAGAYRIWMRVWTNGK